MSVAKRVYTCECVLCAVLLIEAALGHMLIVPSEPAHPHVRFTLELHKSPLPVFQVVCVCGCVGVLRSVKCVHNNCIENVTQLNVSR